MDNKRSRRIIVRRIENGFIFTPTYDSGPIPEDFELDTREWVSTPEVAQIGRTVMSIFEAIEKSLDTEKRQ